MILQKLSSIALDYKINYRRLSSEQKSIWIKNSVQTLGPTYIKIGQFLSNRPDIFQKNRELEKGLKQLRDNVDPIPWTQLSHLVDATKFKEIDRVPLATASIGQVHRAITLDDKNVVIKIRKPQVIDEIRRDVRFYLFILSIVNKIKPSHSVSELIIILNNIRRSVVNECDIQNECRNITKFRDINLSNVKVPYIVNELCTDDIMVMEYVPHIALTDAYSKVYDRKKLSLAIMSLFIQQFIRHGIIHADPHPGNMAILPDKTRFVLYDFGHVVELDLLSRNNMKLFVFELMNENIDNIITIIKRLPDLITIVDEDALRRYIVEYIRYIKVIDVEVLKDLAPRDNLSLPFRFSPKIFEIIRVFGIIEGICLDLDPKFSYFEVFNMNMEMFLSDNDFLYMKSGLDIDNLIDRLL